MNCAKSRIVLIILYFVALAMILAGIVFFIFMCVFSKGNFTTLYPDHWKEIFFELAMSIGFFSTGIALLLSMFVWQIIFEKKKNKQIVAYCPHCGKKL